MFAKNKCMSLFFVPLSFLLLKTRLYDVVDANNNSEHFDGDSRKEWCCFGS